MYICVIFMFRMIATDKCQFATDFSLFLFGGGSPEHSNTHHTQWIFSHLSSHHKLFSLSLSLSLSLSQNFTLFFAPQHTHSSVYCVRMLKIALPGPHPTWTPLLPPPPPPSNPPSSHAHTFCPPAHHCTITTGRRPSAGFFLVLKIHLSLTDVKLLLRHGIFPPIGGFPPIKRSHGSFLRSVQIRWENYRAYLTCERFSESKFANLPRASISFLHGTFLNGVNLFCFGHHQSVHGLTESTTKGSNPIVTCKSAV